MNVDFINKITQKQFELRCEDAMHSIQSSNKEEYLNEVKNNFKNFLQKEKEHFNRFGEIISNLEQKSSSIPEVITQLDKTVDYSIDDQIHINSIAYFVEQLLKNDGKLFIINSKNSDFIETLSFSLFPAISTYFTVNFLPKIEDNSSNFSEKHYLLYQLHNYNNAFLLISQKIKDEPTNKIVYQDFFDLLMRPMFATPLFINFCINFFQPIFSDLQNQRVKKETLPNYLINRFEYYFNFTTHLVPSFIALNLKLSDNPINTLSRSFFEIALSSSESSQYYGLFHYSRPPTEDLLSALRECLTIEGQGQAQNEVLTNIAHKLIDIGDTIEKQMADESKKRKKGLNTILTCSCPEKVIRKEINGCYQNVPDTEGERVSLAIEMKNYYFDKDLFIDQNRPIFRKVLFSSKDEELLKYIYESDGFSPFELSQEKVSFKWVNFGFSEDQSDDVEEEEKHESSNPWHNATMRDNPDDVIPSLRHLLQNSDPIPTFRKLPEEMTFYTFFNEYLVKRGQTDTFSKRKFYEKVIFYNLFRYIQRKEEEKMRLKQKKGINKFNMLTSDPDEVHAMVLKTMQEMTPSQFNLVQGFILAVLPKVTLEQTQEIEYLTIATSVNKKIDFLKTIFNSIHHNIEIIENMIHFKQNSEVYLRSFYKAPKDEYLKDPNKIQKYFNQNNKVLGDQITPEIIIYKMFENEKVKPSFFSFLFETKNDDKPFFKMFMSVSDDTCKLDKQFNEILRNSSKIILEHFLNSRFPTNGDSTSTNMKNQYLMDKLKKIPEARSEIIYACNDAFADLSVLRKVDVYTNLCNIVCNYILEDCPNYIKDLGEDEQLPFMITIIFMSNPPFAASNTLMLKKYFRPINQESFLVDIILKHISAAFKDLKEIISNDISLNGLYYSFLTESSDFYQSILDYV